MKHNVIIEQFAGRDDWVRVHEPTAEGVDRPASSMAHGVSVQRAIRLGKISKMLDVEDGKYYIHWPKFDCRQFCEMLTEVGGYDSEEINRAHDQLLEINPLCHKLSADEIGFVVWKAREVWAEQAVQLDNLFDSEQTLDYPIQDMLDEYLESEVPA